MNNTQIKNLIFVSNDVYLQKLMNKNLNCFKQNVRIKKLTPEEIINASLKQLKTKNPLFNN